ncbi:MAG: glycosyltransferase family 4 protein [Methylococcales bacterium]
MKICLIIDDYLPSSIKVGAKMMHELAVEFVRLGHSVTVVTPAPNLNNDTEISVLDGVTVCCFRSGEIKNVSKVKRAINETLLSYYAWKKYKLYFKQNPHDLIIYYSPTIFWGSLVYRLKKCWGCNSYLILRDFFPQWVIDNGMLSQHSLITYYFRFFEWLNYRAADTIGIQSPKNIAWFSETSSIKKPLNLLYNWAANVAVSGSNRYRQELGLENKVIYFYGGNIGHAQDMMNIVRLAIAMRAEQNAHFVLVGAGDEVELVRNSIAQYNLSNMTLLPPVSQDEFKKMLAEFDIGLFSLHGDHITHNFPGKLLGYMVQGKPILGSVNQGNDLVRVIEKAEAGLVTVNRDDEGFLYNALKLLHDDAYRKKLGGNSKQLLVDIFSVEAAAKQILKCQDKIK